MKNLVPAVLLLLPSLCYGRDAELNDALRFAAVFVGYGNLVSTIGKVPRNYQADGKDILSWRVRLLEYGNEGDKLLYESLDKTKAWNEEPNRTLANQHGEFIDGKWQLVKGAPQMFCKSGTTITHFLGVSGEHAAFNGKDRKVVVKSGPIYGWHAAVVVVKKSDVVWTEPRDFDVKRLSAEATAKEDPFDYSASGNRYLDTTGSPRHMKIPIDYVNMERPISSFLLFDDDEK